MNKGWIIVAIALAFVLIGVALLQRRAVASSGPALHLSEAGLDYVLHVLNSGVCTPEELAAQQPLVQSVQNETDNSALGSFSSALTATENGRWRLVTVGHTGGLLGTCAETSADLETFSGVLGTKYRAVSRAASPTVRCGMMHKPTELQCTGQ
jgi:hypothetical protein